MNPNFKRQIEREMRNAVHRVGRQVGRDLGRAAGDIGREFGKAYRESKNCQYNYVNPPQPNQQNRPPITPPPPVRPPVAPPPARHININIPPIRPPVAPPVVKQPKPAKPKVGGTAKFWLSGVFMLLTASILPLDGLFGMAAVVVTGILGFKLGKKITTALDARKARKEAAKLEAEKKKAEKLAAEKAEEERIQKELERRKKSTGNPELDKIIFEGDDYIERLRKLNDAIEHEGVSACIDRMEAASRGIFEYITDNPSKMPEIKKFMNYYLPTTLKLLTSYEKLDRQAVKGENISATMFDIEGMMETIATAFEKQLDSLFSTDALDIQADIEVFETILTQEGLKSEETTQTI